MNSDNQTDMSSEQMSDDITFTNNIDTTTPNPEANNMEVHHHAHDPAAPHHKKSWKNYFWEFLMLFLAVFCGFLAEYQLEHKIEKDRAAELAESFYAELKVDSAAVNYATEYSAVKVNALKYLKNYLRDSSLTTVSKEFSINNCWATMINSDAIFEPRSAILELLINSGSLRYFKGGELQKLTIDLSIAIKQLTERNQRIRGFIAVNLDPFTVKHLDNDGYLKIREIGVEEYGKSNLVIPYRFYNPEKVDRVEDVNRLGFYARLTNDNVSSYYKNYAILNSKLLVELRRVYKLK